MSVIGMRRICQPRRFQTDPSAVETHDEVAKARFSVLTREQRWALFLLCSCGTQFG